MLKKVILKTIPLIPITVFLSSCLSKKDDKLPLPSIQEDASNSFNTSYKVEEKIDKTCPNDMVHVKGLYCPEVKENCLQWLDVDKNNKPIGASEPTRCAKFAPSECLSKERVYKDFCMDIYEYPNKKGEYPPFNITFIQGQKICKSLGKRLCSDSEWTFACEGEEILPYPYGFERRSDYCNIDHLGKKFEGLKPSEWHTIYMGVPSGSMEKCVSPFGVHDMTGNLDELVVNEKGSWNKKPYISGLKGGAWLRNRNRCRPMTTAHGPEYSFYQETIRCCKDIK
jgi:formylglycine-generating enzyme required for sulfatase activity